MKNLRRGELLDPKLLKDATMETQEDSKEAKLTRKGPIWPLLIGDICLMEIGLVLLILLSSIIGSPFIIRLLAN